MVGGVQAVTWTDVKQMAVIVVGLLAVIIALIAGLPADVSWPGLARRRRGGPAECGRLPLRLEPDLHLLVRAARGLFLMLSYFGCDQSQVQRYLRQVRAGRATR